MEIRKYPEIKEGVGSNVFSKVFKAVDKVIRDSPNDTFKSPLLRACGNLILSPLFVTAATEDNVNYYFIASQKNSTAEGMLNTGTEVIVVEENMKQAAVPRNPVTISLYRKRLAAIS